MSVMFDPDELRELGHRLSLRLNEVAPGLRPVVSDRVRKAVATTEQRRGLRAWAIAHRPEIALRPAALSAAVVVLAIATGIGIGASGLIAVGQSPRPTDKAAATNESASPSPTPTSIPTTGAEIYTDWHVSDLPGTSGPHPAFAHGLAVFKGAVLVVGGVNTGECGGAGCAPERAAAVWRNSGSGWIRQPEQPSFAAGAMESTAATTTELLILGATPNSPRGTGEGLIWPELWLSADGQAFSTYPAPANFTAIVAADSGYAAFLASALSADGNSPEIWRSMDGRTWSKIADSRMLGQGQIETLRRWGDFNFIAVGMTFGGDAQGTDTHSTVWVSQGGQLWTRHDPAPDQAIADVAGDGRLLAVGQQGLGGMAWISTDFAQSWEQIRTPPRWQPLHEVLHTPLGYVALTDLRSGSSGIWTSPDGEQWDAVTNFEGISDDLSGPMIVEPDGSIDLLGIQDPSGTQLPAVWHGNPSRIAPPPPTPAGPTPTPLPVSTDYTRWQSVGMPDPSPHVYGGEWPYAVTELHGQLIAVGAINGGCCTGRFTTDSRAVVWRSADGRSWELEPYRDAFALGHMGSLATNGEMLVAAGSVAKESQQYPGQAEPIGATWTSSDGTTWTRHTGMPYFYGIAWMDQRFYGVSQDPATASSSVWSSVDGVVWSLVRRFAGDYLTGLRQTPLGLVAFGSMDSTAGYGGPTWFSKDGSRWTRYTVPAGPASSIRDVAGNANVLVGVGQSVEPPTDANGAGIWVGYGEWIHALTLDASEAPQLERVVWTGAEFVALGEDPSGIRVFTSSDGVRWRQGAPSDVPAGGPQVTDAVVLPDGRLVVIGVGEGDPGHHGVPLAWIVSS